MIRKMISGTALAVLAVVGLTSVSDATILPKDNCVKVTTGGFFKFAGAFVHQNRDFMTLTNKNIKNRRGDFWMDAEVIIKAEGETECYKYGCEVQLEANPGNRRNANVTYTTTSTSTVSPSSSITFVEPVDAGKAAFINADKVYMYLSNDCFGRVEAGATDSAVDSMFHYVSNFGTGGTDGIYQDFLGDEVIDSAFKPKTHGRSLKVYYVTPRFEGVQIGSSWAPVVGRKGRAVSRHRVALTDPGTGKLADENFENSGEYAMNYVNTFCDDIGVKLSAAFSHAHPLHSVQSHEPWRAYGFGAMFTYAGFSFGGTAMNNGKSGYFKGTAAKPVLAKAKERAFSAGLSYETGPYVIGTNYVTMRTAGDTSIAGVDKADVWAGGATYKAAPGLSLFVEGVTTKRRLSKTPTLSNRGSMALLGSRVDW